jgi:hypothetical protein
MKKSIIVGVLVAVGLLGLVGVSPASAHVRPQIIDALCGAC